MRFEESRVVRGRLRAPTSKIPADVSSNSYLLKGYDIEGSIGSCGGAFLGGCYPVPESLLRRRRIEAQRRNEVTSPPHFGGLPLWVPEVIKYPRTRALGLRYAAQCATLTIVPGSEVAAAHRLPRDTHKRSRIRTC